jgi:hypothetical protein
MRKQTQPNNYNEKTLFPCPKCGQCLTIAESVYNVCLSCKNAGESNKRIEANQSKVNELLALWATQNDYILSEFTYQDYTVKVCAKDDLTPQVVITHLGKVIYSDYEKTETGAMIFKQLIDKNLIKIQIKENE